MIVATRATGLLRTFNEAGYVDVSDVQVAMRLGRLAGETDERALLAVALTVSALRAGSVCLELNRMRELPYEGEIPVAELPWPSVGEVVEVLQRSSLIRGNGKDPLTPLRLVDDELLYLTKYYEQERAIARILDERAATAPAISDLTPELATLFPNPAPDRQRIAAGLALSRWTTVLAGGPGTGKTHTVARILALLFKDNPALRVGLAAPTGKAAAQLEEAVRKQATEIGLPDLPAVTLHRLLGWLPGAGARYRHNATNRLPFDVVVVDECSMVPLTMMYRLLISLRPTTRLILVGDPDQLASVDAGAVLADLVARRTAGSIPALVESDLRAAGSATESALDDAEREYVRGGVVRLSVGRRFNAEIAALATAVREGDAELVIELLKAGSEAISFAADSHGVKKDVSATFREACDAAEAGDAKRAVEATERHRILCAHREGPFGVSGWEREVHLWLGIGSDDRYPGQPLIVSGNDYDLKVFNGDTGVVIRSGQGVMAAFKRGDEYQLVHPGQLASVSSAYAITIHRSQGSQYDTVSVVLPEKESSLLTRELLYTAITRAKNHVRIVGTEAAVRAAVERRVLRASGLRK